MDGKVAVVTGAADGIGREICAELAERGARVIGVDVDAVGLAKTVADIGSGVAAALDVTDARTPDDLVDLARSQFGGGIDILVNNAAVIVAKSVVDCTDDEYDRVMDVNVKAPFRLMRAVIPGMAARGHGAIVNVCSISALVGLPEQSAYCASKGALLQLTRQTSVDFAPKGVRVNAVCPGTVRTPLLERFLDSVADRDATQAQLFGKHPVGRIAEPTEVAKVVAFLCSDEASFVHGAAWSVDGGYVIR